MGYVYYGNYATYYEVGRVEAMRKVGIEYAQLESKFGIWMPVTNLECRFLRAGRYDEELSIHTQIRKLPEQQITFHYEIRNPSNQLINGGRVSLCFVDAKTGKRISAPQFIIEKLKPHFGP